MTTIFISKDAAIETLEEVIAEIRRGTLGITRVDLHSFGPLKSGSLSVEWKVLVP